MRSFKTQSLAMVTVWALGVGAIGGLLAFAVASTLWGETVGLVAAGLLVGGVLLKGVDYARLALKLDRASEILAAEEAGMMRAEARQVEREAAETAERARIRSQNSVREEAATRAHVEKPEFEDSGDTPDQSHDRLNPDTPARGRGLSVDEYSEDPVLAHPAYGIAHALDARADSSSTALEEADAWVLVREAQRALELQGKEDAVASIEHQLSKYGPVKTATFLHLAPGE